MKKLSLCMMALAALASCKKSGDSLTNSKNGSRPLKVDYLQTPATAFNTLFTRSTGGTLTGGDINYSIPITTSTNHTVFWPMGDTFIDPVNASRQHSSYSTLSSTIFLSTGVGGTTPAYAGTLYGVSGGFPVPYYPADGTNRRWCKDAIFLNNKVYGAIFVNKPIAGSGGFGAQLVRTDWAVTDYSPTAGTFTLESTINVGSTDTKTIYGSSITSDGTWVYIYGTEPKRVVVSPGDTENMNYMHVARVSQSSPLSAWTYWNGSSWVSSSTSGARLSVQSGNTDANYKTTISTEYKVFKYSGDSKYYLITQNPYFLGDSIFRYRSTSITGPWTDRKWIGVATYPAGHTVGDGEWTYDAKAHPEFTNPSEAGDLLVSNDCNNTSITAVYNNADLYRPYFSWIAGVVWTTP